MTTRDGQNRSAYPFLKNNMLRKFTPFAFIASASLATMPAPQPCLIENLSYKKMCRHSRAGGNPIICAG
jgi:hypothetical protein